MTSTIDRLVTSGDDEAFHTHDEELRGINFHKPVIQLGSKAVREVAPAAALSDEEANAPHEFNGFGD